MLHAQLLAQSPWQLRFQPGGHTGCICERQP